MTNKFARRAGLIWEILRVAYAALAVAQLVLEILNKVANCDDRELQVQIQVTW
jgi:hypothetical protein